MSSQKGLIGFFDVLGYQNLLENNKPEIVAETVIPIMQGLDNSIIKFFMTCLDKVMPEINPETLVEEVFHKKHKIKIDESTKQKIIEEIFNKKKDGSLKFNFDKKIKEIDWLVFSDTILLNMPIEEIGKARNQIAIFFMACKILMVTMFMHGLPLRGAVDFGDYYINKNCFAGFPIVDTYKLSNMLELSACVVSKELEEKLNKNDFLKFFKHYSSPKRDYLYSYLVPLKDKEEQYQTIAYAPPLLEGENLRQSILSSFGKHNKTIPLAIQDKIRNTEQYFYFTSI
ncbi:hypothetical protein [Desulfobacula sp.]|uniref:hypothetical protein n=1 Tax=Desulfobacula sp. TaxID=2593537 RepID=UPI0025C157A7|nr:hypothetical protein [Desulfobacula sp.]MBC2703518.1 hypothetical protein [Desulfobacula sp.]